MRDRMAKLTKTQMRRLIEAIDSKTRKAWKWGSYHGVMSSKDMMAILAICERNLKKLK